MTKYRDRLHCQGILMQHISMQSVGANVTRVLLVFSILCSPAWALEVSVVALFPGRAMLSVDKGKPRTLRAGETYADVTLVSATSEEAVVSIDGKQQHLRIGEGVYSALS